MSTWRIDFNPDQLYFITTSATQRAHIFRRDLMKQILVDSFRFMHEEDWLELFAFVVMPNHIHFIVRCMPDHPVPDMMRDFKKYTAKKIIRQYKDEGNERALAFLRAAVKNPKKQEFAVWDDYQAKDIFSPAFLLQKLEYVHNNPLQPHWNLVEKAEDYRWSSACFYLIDKPAIIPLDDARLLLA